MKKLFKNKKGFTLMEMLIVVAIIVILVAISMPVFSDKLEDAREATDDANLRAAKSVAVTDYLYQTTGINFEDTYIYDIESGTLKDSGVAAYGKAKNNKTNVIKVSWDAEGKVTAVWGTP